MEELPVAKPRDEIRQAVEAAVRRLVEITSEMGRGGRAVLDWLRVEFGVVKPSQKLTGVAGLSAEELIAEVKKGRDRSKPLSAGDVGRIKEEHARSVAPLQT